MLKEIVEELAKPKSQRGQQLDRKRYGSFLTTVQLIFQQRESRQRKTARRGAEQAIEIGGAITILSLLLCESRLPIVRLACYQSSEAHLFTNYWF